MASGPKAASLRRRGPGNPMPDIVQAQPEIEECDLPEAAADGDVAVAEHLLADLLVRTWMTRHQDRPDAQHGLGPRERHDL